MDYKDHPTQNKANSGANTHNSHPKPSKSELMSSAKLVAEAAKAKLHHEPNKVQTSELAGAAADLLNAASQYGKLDEKGIGKFVDKAESYLHKYETSHSTTTTTTTTTSSAVHGAAGGKHNNEQAAGSGSGYAEYIKMAEGIFKKHSGDSHSGGSGGAEDYLKMASDFLNKKH